MSDSHGTFPPRSGRLAKAAAAGFFPPPTILVAGAGLLGGAAVLCLLGPTGITALTGLVELGIQQALSPEMPMDEALFSSLRVGVGIALPFILVLFLSGSLAALIPAIVARKGRAVTAVPLPRMKLGGPAVVVIRLAGFAVFLLLTAYLLRTRGDVISLLWMEGPSALRTIGSLLVTLFATAGFAALLIGLSELFYTRYRGWQALHLTAAQAEREARVVESDRHLKQERRRRAQKGG